MKLNFFKIFLIVISIVLIPLNGVVNAEQELTVISAEPEKDILKQGESTAVTVVIKNTGDSEVYDFSFLMSLQRSESNDLNVSGNTIVVDLDEYREYVIETQKTSILPGETKTANFFINAAAPKKEEYVLGFAAGGRKGKDKIMNRETLWWPKFASDNLKVHLKIELPSNYYFNKALDYLKSGSYDNAKEYARQAKEAYISSGNSAGVLNCDKIILQSEELLKADVAYKRAKSRMEAEDFKGAMSNAEISFKIYGESGEINSSLISERVPELELMIKSLNKTVTADNYYFDAKEYLESGDYRKAKENAELAKAIYLEQEDNESAYKCESIIEKSESYISWDSMILKISYGIIAITVVFIIYYLYNRNKETGRIYPSGLTIEGSKRIQLPSTGFSEVTNYSEIPEEAIEPYTGEFIHDLISRGKTIVKCNDCGAYYNKEILDYYKMNCARFGCRNSTL